jgi:hypothetical protein
MPTIKVGVREFRERIATFLESDTPIAVTRRGETLGVYVPTRRKRPQTAEISELKAASDRLAEAFADGSAEFFTSPSLEQLAAAQGVNSRPRINDLAGAWPSDESLDEFLELTYRNRS